MRAFLHSMVVVCLAAGVCVGTQGQGGDATRILAATREALGGEQKLAAVKTFVATGRTRQIRGNNLVPIEFEIACELPDKYVRRDEIPAQESGPTSTGFNGEGLIQLPPPPPPAPSAQTAKPALVPAAPPDPRKARVTSIKQDFVRLTLGLFATSFGSYPLTFTLDGQAEAPQGKADIVGVKGAGTFALEFFVNSDTHLPIMVSWTMPATSVVLVVPGQPAPENLPPGSIKVDAPAPPGATATKEEQGKYAASIQDLRKKALTGAKPVEYRIYYADYRDIGNGLKFPFRLRRAIAGETVEETNFDTFKINGRIDPRKFEVVK
jgi:hypothetical protein